MTAREAARLSRRRQAAWRASRSLTLLRTLPHDSPVHRLWAGTKLSAVAVLGVALSLRPAWPVIGILAAAVICAGFVARVPQSAVPRPPLWFWLTLVIGALLTLLSGGRPVVHVANVSVGLGDLELFVRFAAFGVVLVGASALVGWTTPLAEVAPALARLWRPLRWLGLPVDEWAAAVALCVRSLPLLGEEVRTLVAARRLRPRPGGRAGKSRWAALADEPVDLLTAALAAALRRAGEMGQAMDARGGARMVPAGASPGRGDAVALVAVVAVAAGALLIPG